MMIETQELVGPARAAISITAIVCALIFWRNLKTENSQRTELSTRFNKYLRIWILLMVVIAGVFSHTNVFGNGADYLPFGVAPGLILAVCSLFWEPACRAFDRLKDTDIRLMMTFRMIFGAFLFAGAGLGLFPPSFAIIAGIGDLLAGWLSTIATGSIAANGSPFWRWLVHGWGAIDLVDVAILGTFVVRPWIIDTGSPGPSMLLPWVCVPLLFALNIHGLRKVFVDRKQA